MAPSGCNPVRVTTSAFCDGATFQRGCRLSSTVTPKRRISSSGDAVLVNRPHIPVAPLVETDLR